MELDNSETHSADEACAEETEPLGGDEEIDLSVLCRLCANTRDNLMPIFEGDGLEYELSSKIEEHLPIKVYKNDCLPLQICYECASMLLAWHELVRMCKAADKRLNQLRPQDVEATAGNATQPLFDKMDVEANNEMSQEEAVSKSQRVKVNVGKETEVLQFRTHERNSGKSCAEDKSPLSQLYEDGELKNKSINAEAAVSAVLQLGDPDKNGEDETLENERVQFELDEVTGLVQLRDSVKSCEDATLSLRQFYEAGVMSKNDSVINEANDVASVVQLGNPNENCEGGTISLKVVQLRNANENGEGLSISLEHLCEDDGVLSKKDNGNKETVLQLGNADVSCEDGTLSYSFVTQFYDGEALIKPESIKEEVVEETVVEELGYHDRNDGPLSVSIYGEWYDEALIKTEDDLIKTVNNTLIKTASAENGADELQIVEISNYEGNIDEDETLFLYVNGEDAVTTELAAAKTRKTEYTCTYCKKVMYRKANLDAHLCTHTGERPYKCNLCGKGFSLQSYVELHMQRIHADAEERPYKCTECSCTFAVNYARKRHMRIHTGDNPYVCGECGKRWRDRSRLLLHLRTHTDETSRIRGGGDGTRPNPTYRPNQKYFLCSICGKTLGSQISLNYHLMTHTGEKPFLCSHCGKGFKTKSLLVIHTNIHTREVSHPCNTCDKVFSCYTSLKRHVTGFHKGIKPFKCDECGKAFISRHGLAMHHNTHTGLRPFQCVHCTKAFSDRSTLINHTKMVHKVGNKCGVCGKMFRTKSKLAEHVAEHPVITVVDSDVITVVDSDTILE